SSDQSTGLALTAVVIFVHVDRRADLALLRRVSSGDGRSCVQSGGVEHSHASSPWTRRLAPGMKSVSWVFSAETVISVCPLAVNANPSLFSWRIDPTWLRSFALKSSTLSPGAKNDPYGRSAMCDPSGVKAIRPQCGDFTMSSSFVSRL